MARFGDFVPTASEGTDVIFFIYTEPTARRALQKRLVKTGSSTLTFEGDEIIPRCPPAIFRHRQTAESIDRWNMVILGTLSRFVLGMATPRLSQCFMLAARGEWRCARLFADVYMNAGSLALTEFTPYLRFKVKTCIDPLPGAFDLVPSRREGEVLDSAGAAGVLHASSPPKTIA